MRLVRRAVLAALLAVPAALPATHAAADTCVASICLNSFNVDGVCLSVSGSCVVWEDHSYATSGTATGACALYSTDGNPGNVQLTGAAVSAPSSGVSLTCVLHQGPTVLRRWLKNGTGPSVAAVTITATTSVPDFGVDVCAHGAGAGTTFNDCPAGIS